VIVVEVGGVHRMEIKARSLRGIVIGGGVLAIVAAAAAFYLLRYWEDRARYFTEMWLRDLGVLAEQIEGAVDTRLSALRLLVDEEQGALSVFHGERLRNAGLEDVAVTDPERSACDPPGSPDSPTSRDGKRPSEEPTVIQPPQRLNLNAVPRGCQVARSTDPFGFGTRTTGGDPTLKRDADLYFAYRDQCAKISLAQAIEPFVGQNGLADVDLFILAGTNVIYERGSAAVRLASLAKHPAVKKTTRHDADQGHADEQNGAGGAADDNAPASGFPTADEIRHATTVRDVSIGDVSYKLFTHPIRTRSNEHWVLGALVSSQQFGGEVRSFSFGALTYVPLLLVLAVVLAPVLKLGTMGSRARLRRWDVRLVALSLIVGAGMLAVFVLDNYAYLSLEHVLDAELRAVSSSMRTQFAGELEQAAGALDTFTTRWVANRVNGKARSKIFGASPDGIGSLPDNEFGNVIADLRNGYPFFDMIGWADGDSWQKEKWSTGTAPTSMFNIADYPVVKDSHDGRTWSIFAGANGNRSRPPRQPAVHLMLSPHTAKLVPLLAIQAGDDGKTAFMVPEMMSVAEPLLPAGFGFAIVQSDGQVVFHSIRSRSLYENFFAESDCSQAVRSAMEAASAEFVDGHYRGSTYRFYVHPIEDSPWTLVVFRDKELARALDLDVLMTWGILFFAYLLALVIVYAVLRVVVPCDDADLVWPAQTKAATYHAVLLLLIGITIGETAVLALDPRPSYVVIAAAVGLTVLAAAATYLRLSADESDTPQRRRRRWIAWSGVAVAGAIALPTLGDLGVAHIVAGVFILVLSLALRYATPAPPRRVRDVVTLILLGAALVGLAATLNGWANPLAAAMFGATAVGLGALLLAQYQRGDPPLSWRQAYVAAAAGLVVVFGALPAAVMYQDAFNLGLEVLVRHGQLRMAGEIDQREDRIRRQYAAFDAPLIRDQRLNSGPAASDIVRSAILADQHSPCPQEQCPGHPDRLRDAGLRQRIWEWVSGTPCAADQEGGGWLDEPLCRMLGEHFSSAVMTALPVYHPESLQLRGLVRRRAADGRWSWDPGRHTAEVSSSSNGVGDAPRLEWNRWLGDGRTSRWVIRAAERLRIFDRPVSPLAWAVAVAGVCLGLALLASVMRWIIAAIFGVRDEAPEIGTEPPCAVFARGVFAFSASLEVCADDSRCEVIDFRRDDIEADGGARLLERARASARPCVVLQHLEERFDDVDRTRLKLSLLEDLVSCARKPFVVMSQIEPLGYLTRRIQSRWDSKADDEASRRDINRWARVCERLAWVGPDAPLSDEQVLAFAAALPLLRARWPQWVEATAEGAATPLAVALREECAATARLNGIGLEVWAVAAARGEAAQLDERSAIQRVRAATGAHYRSLWSLLTDEEQLTLFHLAKEGFVSPRSWRIVDILRRKRLVRADGMARLMNQTFPRFVEQAEAEGRVRDWEHADGASSWDRLRNAILVLLVVGGVVLYLTQPEALTRWVGAVAAIGSAAATVANLFGFFGSPRSGSPHAT
jgi:hypothetical protein